MANARKDTEEINELIYQTLKQEPTEPTEEKFIWLCNALHDKYSTLPNLLPLSQLVTVVGSVHAQFDDLLEIFDIYGKPPYTCYLFLGNFVNYGSRNVLTITLLFALALKYPSYFFLLRGSHESRRLTRKFGVFQEIINLYGSPRAWEQLMLAFDSLPLAAVCNKFFFVSGGISKSITKLSQINSFNRLIEIPTQDEWSELIFNAPNKTVQEFTPIPKDIGFYYGLPQFEAFLETNDLEYLVYSKQLCQNGYDISFSENCINLWSAPKFFGWMQNEAAVLQIISHTTEQNKNYRIDTFRARPESERLPNKSQPVLDVSPLEQRYFDFRKKNEK